MTTTKLQLPLIAAAQAQKHVTHNEALQILDALAQLSVRDRDLAAPPASPADGECWIVGPAASGAWAGREGQIAAWQDGVWRFLAPRPGWTALVVDEGIIVHWTGTSWTPVAGTSAAAPASPARFAINADADTANRLTVKADAVLFSHDDRTPGSGDARVKINKATAAGTASILLQRGFSGRAEIGLAGDDRLHVKLSADGAAWTEAMTLEPNGRVGLGTSAPLAKLHVSASDASIALFGPNAGQGRLALGATSVRQIDANTAQMISSNGNLHVDPADGRSVFLGFYNHFASVSSAATVCFVSRDVATGRSINAAGTINASGADYAEYEVKAPGCGEVAKGAIVGFDASGRITDRWADSLSFGIKSTAPAYVGGDTWGADLGPEGERPALGEDMDAAREAARRNVDRIAYCGKVPVEVLGAAVGDYIVVSEGGEDAIAGHAVPASALGFDAFRLAVGRVRAILDDGRALVAVIVH